MTGLEGRTGPVGFAGVGNMGGAIAERLLQAGYELVVYDRQEDPVQRLVAQGGQQAVTPGDLGERAMTVLLCLPNSDVVEHLIFDDAGLGAFMPVGSMIIDLTTGDPERSSSFARRLALRGVGYIDAPVTGGVAKARRGELTAYAGGDAETIKRLDALLSTFAGRVLHVGDVGRGNAIKIVNNMVAAGTRWLTVEAVGIAQHLGIDPVVAVEALNCGSGRSFHTEVTFPEVLLTDNPRQGASFATYVKDLGLAQQLAGDQGIELALGSHLLQLYRALADELGADTDISTMVDHIAKPT